MTAPLPPTRPTPRPGPRPLPLHLFGHLMTLAASQAALPLWRSGSLAWKPPLQAAAQDLRASLDAAGPEAIPRLEAALAAEAARRHLAFLDGIAAYRRHRYHRNVDPPAACWAAGTTRLLDYRPPGGGGVPVLVIPSLVNRAYVLDLLPGRSLMRTLADKGLAPFLVDWDAPGPEEAGFDLTEYVERRLDPILDRVAALTGRRVALLGYCMGGLFALALAQRRPEQVSGLALLATPFDFTAGRAGQAALIQALAPAVSALIAASGTMPVDLLQAMFAGLDPGLAARKFTAFAGLAPASARARAFVALEDWANDGVALAGPVARECLIEWYGGNSPALGRWAIGGRAVRPEEIGAPTLLIVPETDRIVPPESALPLAGRIRRARLWRRPGGHVGMLVARRARSDLFSPLALWLRRRG